MLILIGLGLYDEADLTFRGLDIAKQCDSLYAETYTSAWQGSLSRLEEMTGKKIVLLQRKDLEEDAGRLIGEARRKKVGIFIPGDPLVATTHSSLLLEARKLGVVTQIVHASSVYSAIAESGLHIYKFGKTVSLPASGAPKSLIETVSQNQKLGLHTLMLCDIGLKFSEARRMVHSYYKGKIVVMSRLGSDTPRISYGLLASMRDELPEPFVFVIPGHLHFSEEEMLVGRR